MIDLKKVREDIAGYKLICQKKGKCFDIDAILALDDKRKALQLEIDQTKAQQKQLAAQKDYEGAKNLKIQIQELETQHTQVDTELKSWLLKCRIPLYILGFQRGKMTVKMWSFRIFERFRSLIFRLWIILN